MKFIADLQIHSKYSRATSKQMILEEIDRWAYDKGIGLMGTGDFTHPDWFREIQAKLEPAEPGLFKLKKEHKRLTIRGEESDTRFMLTVEISGIYTKNSKGRRVHTMIFAPDMKTAEKINIQLSRVGNLRSDGRPILGLDAEKLAEMVFNINPEAVVVPAHAWTPWFAVFGSMSGFDSLEECFGPYAKQIFAIETGLSSDPAMNWRLSQLDNISLISNSDSHSLPRIGREANIFDTELSYDGVINAIKSGIPNIRTSDVQNIKNNLGTSDVRKSKFVATIEFFPEEGKYHLDGHRNCGVYFEPEETKKQNNICPKCGKKLTIGVLNRVEALADRPPISVKMDGYLHYYENRVPYYSLVPLDEVISKSLGAGLTTIKVKAEYNKIIRMFGGEFKALMEADLEDMIKNGIDAKVANGIKAIREGRVKFNPPGFDGEYGNMEFAKVEAFKEKKDIQESLF
jgi:uncharacterized protein (TIGR00375 family)